jgi:hypothetical protein
MFTLKNSKLCVSIAMGALFAIAAGNFDGLWTPTLTTWTEPTPLMHSPIHPAVRGRFSRRRKRRSKR